MNKWNWIKNDALLKYKTRNSATLYEDKKNFAFFFSKYQAFCGMEALEIYTTEQNWSAGMQFLLFRVIQEFPNSFCTRLPTNNEKNVMSNASVNLMTGLVYTGMLQQTFNENIIRRILKT
jgi:hypothetical protein